MFFSRRQKHSCNRYTSQYLSLTFSIMQDQRPEVNKLVHQVDVLCCHMNRRPGQTRFPDLLNLCFGSGGLKVLLRPAIPTVLPSGSPAFPPTELRRPLSPPPKTGAACPHLNPIKTTFLMWGGPTTCFLGLSFGSIASQISALRGVINRTFPWTTHIAYTTA